MRCYLCTYVCNLNLKHLILHWRTFHNLNENSLYECTAYDCGRKFSSLNSFKKHFKSKHDTYFADNVAVNETNNRSLSVEVAKCSTLNENPSNLVSSSLKRLKFKNVFSTSDENSGTSCSSSSKRPKLVNDLFTLDENPSTSSSSSSKHTKLENNFLTLDENLSILENENTISKLCTNYVNFSDIVNSQMQVLITSFYSKPTIPRNIVQSVIDELEKIINIPKNVFKIE